VHSVLIDFELWDSYSFLSSFPFFVLFFKHYYYYYLRLKRFCAFSLLTIGNYFIFIQYHLENLLVPSAFNTSLRTDVFPTVMQNNVGLLSEEMEKKKEQSPICQTKPRVALCIPPPHLSLSLSQSLPRGVLLRLEPTRGGLCGGKGAQRLVPLIQLMKDLCCRSSCLPLSGPRISSVPRCASRCASSFFESRAGNEPW